MGNKQKIRYYNSFTDDFTESKNQNYILPESYKWIRNDIFSRFLSVLIYSIALLFANIYCRLFLHIRIKGAENIRREKGGIFLYGNHTQPIGDVFNPALCVFPKRIYTVISPANMGIPIIGKILPYLGGLPISDTINGIKELNRSIKHHLEKNRCIVIYPEAHVWEYYTDIRPFPEVSFKFPVKFSAPVYSMTATYQKQKLSKKPLCTIYIDGPFKSDKTKSSREQAIFLCNKVYEGMKKRSENSNYSYIKYERKK